MIVLVVLSAVVVGVSSSMAWVMLSLCGIVIDSLFRFSVRMVVMVLVFWFGFMVNVAYI